MTVTSKRPTLRDVADHAGVSVATVSRVLSGSSAHPVSTQQKVLRSARELAYIGQAQQLVALDRSVAVLLNNARSPFFVSLAASIEEEVLAAGNICLVSSTGANPATELSLIAQMRQRQVAAVIIAGGVAETEEYLAELADEAAALSRQGSRLVLCGRTWQGPSAPVWSVDYDDESGAHAATSHLIAQGHRRILHLAGPTGRPMATRRLAGYRRAMREAGLVDDPDLVLHDSLPPGSGTRVGRDLLERTRATAVFAINDEVAARAMSTLREDGYDVPGEVSVVGFDDVPLARDLFPPLTTVAVPTDELGRQAANCALGRDSYETPGVTQLATELVVRDSTARAATT